MIKANDRTTETYKVELNFCVDVVETETSYEAWLYGENMGVKEYMWGEPKTQGSKEKFINLVKCNLPDYAASYIKEYMCE